MHSRLYTLQGHSFTPFFGTTSYTHQFPVHASHIPPMTGSGSQNNIHSISTTSNVQTQSSPLPMTRGHGVPPIRNVTRMIAMQNVNAESINQAQSSLPMGTVY